ncbi:hypothetical protein ISN44_As08g001900 [Arabidopsis suecica]|uniref:Uncharacterized protein n=1 Tax=Arabidopsis suecica TaxID=45249 RepID=A0A8T2B0X6_ARASU|nr:hypothetical protein ISN44_As08g001900 [Arabidopsis suecica]KAG7580386.1 hypothetical protein ISN44_As08g001900 [Arabidopsis suecica]
MNHCSLQQNAFMSRDESRGFVPIYCHPMDSVVCPKPRRANNVIRPLRLHFSQSGADDVCDSKAGEDLLDIFRRKESVSSTSPPFFLGSPPSRAANPLAQDARFGDKKLITVSPTLSPLLSSASRVKAGGGGCGRMKFGVKPATVRVEGFDCLNRDRQNSSIPAMA